MEVSHSEIVGAFPSSFLGGRHGNSSSSYIVLIVLLINEVT